MAELTRDPAPAGARAMPLGPFLEAIATIRLVPVLTVGEASTARDVASALRAGGLPCAEVTLRTPAALEAIRAMAWDPEKLVGAGTVLTPEQVEEAVAAGAGSTARSTGRTSRSWTAWAAATASSPALSTAFWKRGDLAAAVEYGAAHGALAMTTPGDTSTATLAEVEQLVKGAGARIRR